MLEGACTNRRKDYVTKVTPTLQQVRPIPEVCMQMAGIPNQFVSLEWRRGGDSNPRHPFGVKLISSQPCSATPAPLRRLQSVLLYISCGSFTNAPASRVCLQQTAVNQNRRMPECPASNYSRDHCNARPARHQH